MMLECSYSFDYVYVYRLYRLVSGELSFKCRWWTFEVGGIMECKGRDIRPPIRSELISSRLDPAVQVNAIS